MSSSWASNIPDHKRQKQYQTFLSSTSPQLQPRPSAKTNTDVGGSVSVPKLDSSDEYLSSPFVKISMSRRLPSPPSVSGTAPGYKLAKAKPYSQLHDATSSGRKLHRIYSENETSNFNEISGRRMYDDEKHRPYRIRKSSGGYSSSQENKVSAKSFYNFTPESYDYNENRRFQYGLEDEYIPDFDFGDAVLKWTSSYSTPADVRSTSSSSAIESISSSLASTPIGQTHAQVEPVSVPVAKAHHNKFSFDLNEDEERIISKLPQNFTELPFSVRRRLIAEISPSGNLESINKIIKKKFKKRHSNSPAAQYLSSFSEKSSKIDDRGNVIMNHTLGNIIGYGAWGIIRECHSSDGACRAIKIVRTKNSAVAQYFRRETTIWGQLNHNNILSLLNVKETPNAIFCLMNRIDGGTLFDLISKWGLYPSKVISVDERLKLVKRYALDIISALTYMHSKNIVHGDVKLENCLIDNTRSPSKSILCDFGMSVCFKQPEISDDITLLNQTPPRKIRRVPSIPRSASSSSLKTQKTLSRQIVLDKTKAHDDTKVVLPNSALEHSQPRVESKLRPLNQPKEKLVDPNLPHSHIGSLPYASPELLESNPPPLGPSADVWAFGVLLYTMIVGKLPFQHSFEPRLRAMISAGKYDADILRSATNDNSFLIKAVKGCLIPDMNKRLDLESVQSLLIKG